MTHAARGLRSLLVVVALGLAGRAAPGAEHAPGDIVVDSSVRWIQRCTSVVLAFRTPGDGWLADGCGALFRSHDGGHHWVELAPTVPPLSLLPTNPTRDAAVRAIEWLDERIGLVFGDGVVVRTSNGGQTWQAQPLQRVQHVTHVGTRVWACDWNGRVVRSDDAGASWRELAPITGPCSGLSFADGDYGWREGTTPTTKLWQTSDGGESWRPVPLPDGVTCPSALRLTRDIGWIYQNDVDPDTRIERAGSIAPTTTACTGARYPRLRRRRRWHRGCAWAECSVWAAWYTS